MQQFIIILAVAITTARTAYAQSSSPAILSCLELGCPGRTGTAPEVCTVGNKSFSAVGNSQISSQSPALTGLSWTEGVSILSSPTGRIFEKSFYLGTPQTLNLTGTGGCAIFFTEVNKTLQYNPAIPIEISQGTCVDAMSKDCISALTKRALKVDVEGLDGADVCESLRTALMSDVDSSCVAYTIGGKWTGLSVRELSGPRATPPLTSTQNSTSNCWPVEPKQHDLSLINVISNPGDGTTSSIINALYGVVPILTFFYPSNVNGDGDGTLIKSPEAQLTCMKTIGMDVQRNATMSNGNASSGSSPPLLTPGGVSLASIMIGFSLGFVIS